ncbi:MAG: SRPBCC family protein [Myxococcota bacterium]
MNDFIIMAGGGAAALAAATPFFLPSEAVVARRRQLDAAPSRVFALLQSSQGYQTFNPYCDTDSDLEISFFGPAEGVGAGFRFDGREGRGTQTIVSLVQDREVVVEIDLGAMGRPVTTFSLEPTDDGGTEVSWTTVMRFGRNPLKRAFGLFADRFLGPTYDRGLANLEHVLA